MSDSASRKLFVPVCIALLVGMLLWKSTESWRENRQQSALLTKTSDAAKIDHTVTILGDDWLGYLIFRSPHFRRVLEEKAIAVRFEMEPDFQKRFEKLASGECEMVCATIDSFLVNARTSNFPGVIVFGIDESYGGDAVIGVKEVASIDDLRAETATGAFVGFSPSEFLLKSQIAHFGIENLKPKLAGFRTDDASAAFKKLKSGQANFAVLWEPFVSKALQEIPGAQRIMDTRQARGVIYDVAIASRGMVAEKPEVVREITNAYFATLNHYLSNEGAFKELAKEDSGESRENVDAMIGGIRFLTILDNREMANGTGDLRMTDAVANITRILLEVGDLSSDPLNGNPRLIVNSTFLNEAENPTVATSAAKPIRSFFGPLSEAEWDRLDQNRTGTLLEKPIAFAVGQATIPDEFQVYLRLAALKLVHYPRHRVLVQAHVSPGSDPEADLELSQERADAIRDFLVNEAGVAGDRIRALGKGGLEPLEKQSGESLNAWKRRCRRAKIYLAEDS